ncbi:MAG: hypothetical protein ACP5EQ_06485 [Candidatus Cloacimonadia bacterium]
MNIRRANFEKLAHNFHESFYNYMNQYVMQSTDWTDIHVDTLTRLVSCFAYLHRAIRSVKNPENAYEAYTIPSNLWKLLQNRDRDDTINLLEKKCAHELVETELRLDKINDWLLSVEENDDKARTFWQDRFKNNINDLFIRLDLIITLAVELSLDVERELAVNLIQKHLALFKLVGKDIATFRSEHLVPQIKEYEYFWEVENYSDISSDLIEYLNKKE